MRSWWERRWPSHRSLIRERRFVDVLGECGHGSDRDVRRGAQVGRGDSDVCDDRLQRQLPAIADALESVGVSPAEELVPGGHDFDDVVDRVDDWLTWFATELAV